MSIKHRIQISIKDSDGKKRTILRGGVRYIPRRIAQWLFGESLNVLVLKPGQSVETVEIHEVKKGEQSNE